MDSMPVTPVATKTRALSTIPDSQDSPPSSHLDRSTQVKFEDGNESDASSILVARPGTEPAQPTTETKNSKKVVKLEDVESKPRNRYPRQQPARDKSSKHTLEETPSPAKPKRPRPIGMMAYRSAAASRKNLVLYGEDGDSDVYFDSDGEVLEGNTIVVDELDGCSVAHRTFE